MMYKYIHEIFPASRPKQKAQYSNTYGTCYMYIDTHTLSSTCTQSKCSCINKVCYIVLPIRFTVLKLQLHKRISMEPSSIPLASSAWPIARNT